MLKKHKSMDHRKELLNLGKDETFSSTEEKPDSELLPTSKGGPSLACLTCGMEFQKMCGLSSHKRTHFGHRPFSCCWCSLTFTTKIMLKRHQKKYHDDGLMAFQEKDKELQKHKSRSNIAPYREKEKMLLKKHIYENEESLLEKRYVDSQKSCKISEESSCSVNKKYTCNICNRVFAKYLIFMRHRNLHRSGKRLHKCPKCLMSFHSKYTLSYHLKSHSDVQNCHVCGQKGIRRTEFKRHMKMHRSNCDDNSIKNSLITEQYPETKRVDSLTTQSLQRVYKCQICGKTMKHPGNYTMHMKAHLKRGEVREGIVTKIPKHKKPERSFSTEIQVTNTLKQMRETLVQHDLMSQILVPSGQKQIVCKLCGKCVATRGHFTLHMRAHQMKGEMPGSVKPETDAKNSVTDSTTIGAAKPRRKTYTCEICLKVFLTLKKLERHERMHGAIKKVLYRCSICEKHFKKKWALERHVALHSKNTFNSNSRSFLNGHELTDEGKEFSSSDNDEYIMNMDDDAVSGNIREIHSDEANSSADNVSESFLSQCRNGKSSDIEKAGYLERTKYPVFRKRPNKKPSLVNQVHSSERKVVKLWKTGKEKSYSRSEGSLSSNKQEKLKAVPSQKSVFPCKICNKHLSTYDLYRKHQKMHSQKRENKCITCVKTYKNRSSYIYHLKRHHPGLPPHFDSRERKHGAEDSYEGQEERLSTDEQEIAKNTAALVSGSMKAGSVSGIGKHDGKLSEGCRVVIRKLPLAKLPERPVASPASSLTFGCVESQQRSDLHISKKPKGKLKANIYLDKTREKPFVCRLCDKGFKNQKYVELHMEVHSEQRAFKCEICHKSSSSALRLKRHLSVHYKEKSFSCSVCGKAFNENYKLKNHIKLHNPKKQKVEKNIHQKLHDPKKQKAEKNIYQNLHDRKKQRANKNIPAKIGSKSDREKQKTDGEMVKSISVDVNSVQKASIHVRTPKSYEEGGPHKKVSVSCPICGKVCNGSSQLEIHIIRHSTDRPYKCPLCLKIFKRDISLRKHIRNIHSLDPHQFNSESLLSSVGSLDLPYKCSVCDKGFIYDTSLKMHMMLHTKESSVYYGECEEEVYECGVERNEDDGTLLEESVDVEESVVSVKVEETVEEEKDYLEDMTIDIKEEVFEEIDGDCDDEDAINFPVMSDLNLEEEMTASEDFTFTMNTLSSNGIILTHVHNDKSMDLGSSTVESVGDVEEGRLCLQNDLEVGISGESSWKNIISRLNEKSLKKRHVFCVICNSGFANSQQFFLHILTHGDRVLYKCDVCGERFTARESYKQHALKHLARVLENSHNINFEDAGEWETQFDGIFSSFMKRKAVEQVSEKNNSEISDKSFQGSVAFCCEVCNERLTDTSSTSDHLDHHLSLLFDNIPLDENIQFNFLQRTTNLSIQEQVPLCTICGEWLPSVEEVEEHKRSHF